MKAECVSHHYRCVALLPQTSALPENVAVRRGSSNLGVRTRASGEIVVAPVSPPAKRGPLNDETPRRLAPKVLDDEDIAATKTALTMRTSPLQKTALTTRTTTRAPPREKSGEHSPRRIPGLVPGILLHQSGPAAAGDPATAGPLNNQPFTNCRAPPARLHDSM